MIFTLIESSLSSLSRNRSCVKLFARPGELPGNGSGNLGKTSPYSPYIAPGCSLWSCCYDTTNTQLVLTEPVPGILMVGGKEIGGGPVETFPAETCAGKVQHWRTRPHRGFLSFRRINILGCCCVQIPDLDTEWGGWYFFTLSLIPRDTRGWEGDGMLVNILNYNKRKKLNIFQLNGVISWE